MWVQLTSVQHLDLDGQQRTYRPGDWADLGKQTALRLIGSGQARAIRRVPLDTSGQCGVVLLKHPDRAKAMAVTLDTKLKWQDAAEPCLPFDKTMLWDASYHVRMDLVAVGFHWLDRWDVCAPLADYDVLADTLGTPEERAQTKAVIRDLRVPYYDTRLVFLKRSDTTLRLLAEWAATPGDRALAFLVALYKTRPLIVAAPTTWSEQ